MNLFFAVNYTVGSSFLELIKRCYIEFNTNSVSRDIVCRIISRETKN